MGQAAPGKVLIIGDGLAGALMAWECQERGLDFEQWSNGSPAASDVAAGMFNPVSFRRILPQWDAANHSERAREVFGAIETKLASNYGMMCPLFGFSRMSSTQNFGRNEPMEVTKCRHSSKLWLPKICTGQSRLRMEPESCAKQGGWM